MRPTILLVEDDADCAKIFALVLGHEFEVVTTRDKRAAMSALASREFDAVVADWRLPDGFGTDVLDEAARSATFGVLVTGFAEAGDEVNPQGRFTILYKPIDNEKLVCWARNAVARTELARACAR